MQPGHRRRRSRVPRALDALGRAHDSRRSSAKLAGRTSGAGPAARGRARRTRRRCPRSAQRATSTEPRVASLGLGRALWRHGKTAERPRADRGRRSRSSSASPGRSSCSRTSAPRRWTRSAGGREEAIEWAEKGIALAGELGVENVVRHLQMRGLARVDLGDCAGLEDMRRRSTLALRLGLGIETGTSYLNLGEMIAAFEDLDAGPSCLDASLEFARRRGLTHHEMWTRGARLWHLYERGRVGRAPRRGEELLRWDREQGGTQIEVNVLLATTPVLAHRGRSPRPRGRSRSSSLARARSAIRRSLGPALTAGCARRGGSGKLDEARLASSRSSRASRAVGSRSSRLCLPSSESASRPATRRPPSVSLRHAEALRAPSP